ncbi:hypothetical protein RMATCC62417_18804 [Rhizopus microsporus]|nr:hypothetical protein RMATCC62417_18804 [Rhizopus microsporus]
MQQDLYQGQIPPAGYVDTPNIYRICGKFHVGYSGPVACVLWIVINLYAAVLSFQGRSPIYSYLNSTALFIQGVVCVIFVLSALVSLYIFSVGIPEALKISHRVTWTIVIVFLIDYFINMVVFGVQKNQFNGWCINKARKNADESLSIVQADGSNLQVLYSPTISGSDLYNCTRLWENELKFGVVVFVILFVFYVHIAFCFWNFTQEKLLIRAEMMRYHFSNPYVNTAVNHMHVMSNMKPSKNKTPL